MSSRDSIEFQSLLLFAEADLRLTDRDIVSPIAMAPWNVMTQTGSAALGIVAIDVDQKNSSALVDSGFLLDVEWLLMLRGTILLELQAINALES